MEPLRVHIAELVIADDPASADVASADIVTERATAVGHAVVGRAVVKDTELAIREQLQRWIAQADVDVVIVTGAVESTTAAAALRPLVTQPIAGFTDLFRWLAFQEIGASAMQSNAEAAQCGTTFVFVLPAVLGAVRAAMDKLINPQLDPATPKNLVTQMPRLVPLVDAARARAEKSVPQAIDAAKTEAVPQPIGPEKTEGGIGMPARLPARKSPTGQHVLRKEPAPDVTRQVDREQLERDLKASMVNDAPTKPSIDIRSLIPRVPPGADDDGTLDVGDDTDITMAAPQPFARVKLAKQPIPSIKARTTDEVTDELPPVRTETIVTKAAPPSPRSRPDTDVVPPPAPASGTSGPSARSGRPSESGPGATSKARAGRSSESVPNIPSGPAAKSGARRTPPALTPPAGATTIYPKSKRPATTDLDVVSIEDLAARAELDGPTEDEDEAVIVGRKPADDRDGAPTTARRPGAADEARTVVRKPGSDDRAARSGAADDAATRRADEARTVVRKPGSDEAATHRAGKSSAADEAATHRAGKSSAADEAATHRAGAEPPMAAHKPGADDVATTPDREPATTRKAGASGAPATRAPGASSPPGVGPREAIGDAAPSGAAPTSDSGPTRRADAVRVDEAAKRRPPTEPPPPPGARARRQPTPPPPPPKSIRPDTTEVVDDELVGASAIVAVATGAAPARAKVRTPTEPPPPRESSDDLPRGKFEYPVKRSSAGRLAIWGALAVLAAAAGIAFVKFFIVDKQQAKVATTPADAAQVAVATPDAVAVAPDAVAPDVDPGTSDGSGSSASASGSNGGRPDDGHDSTGGSATGPANGHAMDDGHATTTTATAAGGHATATTSGGHTTTTSGGHTTTTTSGGHATTTTSGGHTTTSGGTTGITTGGQTGASSGGHSSDAASGPAAPPPDPGCDEVSCVMEKYARACCARYKPADSGFKPGAGGVPEELDKTMVRAGIEKVKPRVIACGEKTATKGTVKISVSVGPEGDVKDASVVETPSPDLGSCVASALRGARFVRTAKGGSFTYPFVF